MAMTVERGAAALVRDLMELSKFRIVMLVLVTAAAGYAVAPPGSWLLFANMLLGTALVAAGTNALNQWWERDRDARMARTRRRPVPAGRLGESEALLFSVSISALGVIYLAVFVNLLTSMLALGTLVSYLFVYTPLKTRTPLCTVVGAVPGAVPPVIGYAAATGRIDATALALFALLFAWQLPHFLALSWLYREDYARGGFKMLSVVEPSGAAVGQQAFSWSVVLAAISLAPYVLGVTSALYLAGALIAGAALSFAAWRFASRLEVRSARVLFHGSNLYLIAVMALLVAAA